MSARWQGKLLAPSSETFTLYVRADDAARLYFDHELVIDAWEGETFPSRLDVVAVPDECRSNVDCTSTRGVVSPPTLVYFSMAETSLEPVSCAGVLPGAIEYRASVEMVGGSFHDIVLEYREKDGAANIQVGLCAAAPAVIALRSW